MILSCMLDSALGLVASATTGFFVVYIVLLFVVSILGTPVVMWLYMRQVTKLMATKGEAAPAEPVVAASVPPVATAARALPPDGATLAQASARQVQALRRWLVTAAALFSGLAGLLLTFSPMKLEAAGGLPLVMEDHWLAALAVADVLLLAALCAPVVLIGISHPHFGRLYWRRCAPLIVLALATRAALTESGDAVPAFITAALFAAPLVALFYRALGHRNARHVAPLLSVAWGLVMAGLLAAAALAEISTVCVATDDAGGLRSLLGLLLMLPAIASPVLMVWAALRLLRWLSQAYERKVFSEAQLQQACWWLVLLAISGVGIGGMDRVVGWWLPALGAVALGVFLLYLFGTRRLVPCTPPLRLLLLRVFAHDERGERLLDEAAYRWRFLGPIMMIGGPDLARHTLDPSELLLFLRGRVRDQFVTGEADLQRQMAALDERPDPDARYRVNEFFCFDDMWQRAVERLVARSDVVLLDLRDFTEARRGTAFEIALLAQRNALARTVFLVDEGTDRQAVVRTLAEAGATDAAQAQVLDAGRQVDGERLFLALANAAAAR